MGHRIKRRKTKKQEERKASKIRPILIWGGLVVGIIGLAYLLFLNMRGPTPITDVIRSSGQERGHDNTIVHTGNLPPVGGVHSDIWQNCGIYAEPIDTDNAVHSLEHGAVWIAYQPDLPEEDVIELRDIARDENYLLLSPYPNLESPIVLTAWEVQLELESVNDARIKAFINRYQQGPTTPEKGAPCSDGIGTPML